ncbi:DOMON-like domain-containing protein [Rhodoferax sp.]|uniref:DOMON-like domain-containing protein n=1 Tax=Rhodoferax sp. TaxID=50421 RepID=UPI002746B601|nr:DOMON-like domain-containing protein [Rhodoferax sp.]MDP2416265.1 DOMON-like domain-containing protein [Hydrogenophaga sp.]MDZ4207498.1 DOMON-like domain-containing protein [Rhodoferax sp.]
MTSITTPSSTLPAQAVHLVCHPATPCAQELQLTVSLALAGAVTGHDEASAGLLLRYQLTGDVAALKVPTPTLPAAADGLWQHTCFEAFVAVAGEAAYREFNFSPSGQWAAYRFGSERVRDNAAEASQSPVEPLIEISLEPHALVLQVWLAHSALPFPQAGETLQLGLSAVVEDHLGQLRYWALTHPAAQPDFHHRGGLALPLPFPLFDAQPASPIKPSTTPP